MDQLQPASVPFRQIDWSHAENSAGLVRKRDATGRELALPPSDMCNALGLGKIYLASPQGLLRNFVLGALLRFTQGAANRRHEPRQSRLQNKVRCTTF